MTASAAPTDTTSTDSTLRILTHTDTLQKAAAVLAQYTCMVAVRGMNGGWFWMNRQHLLHAMADGMMSSEPLSALRLPTLPLLPIHTPIAQLQSVLSHEDTGCVGLCHAVDVPVRLVTLDDLPAISAAPPTLLAEAFLKSPHAQSLSELSDGRLLAVNEAFEALTGYRAAEVLGRLSSDMQFLADGAQRSELVSLLRRDGQVLGHDILLNTAGGKNVPCLFSGRVLELDGRQLLLSTLFDHSARHQSEALVRRERAMLDTLLNTVPDLIWLKDPAGIYLRCNRQFERLVGVPEGDSVGRSDYELFGREDAEYFREHDRRAIAAEQPCAYEYQLSWAENNHTETFEAIKTPMLDGYGRVIGVLGVARNVSARLHTEQRLTAERDLFAGGPVGVITRASADDWRISYASPNIDTILGYDAQACCQREFRLWDHVHPEDLNNLRRQYRTLEASQQDSWEQRYRVQHKRGYYIWLSEHAVVERNADSSVRLLHSYVMDESERVAAENRIALAASVFDHAHEGILITSAERNIVEVNPMFCRITGYGRDEVIGRNPNILKSGCQDDDFYDQMWTSIDRQGYWQGEIYNRRKDGEVYIARMTLSAIRDERGRLVNYVSVFADITQIKKHQERLELLAHYDSLTRLPNRVLLAEKLTTALRYAEESSTHTAVCYLDLDGFKPVNDRYGHDMGDQLLVELASRLSGLLNESDCVARLGGDEFVMLFNGLQGQVECEQAARQVLETISLPVVLENRTFQLSASMGITLYPDDPSDEDLLLRHADQAMYQAKMAGRNQYHFYDPVHDARTIHQREAIDRIRLALRQNEFVLYLQPKVDLVQRQVLGFEALIRWQHPERGLLAPGAFLPLLVGDPLEAVLDHWVLTQAFTMLQRWQRQGFELQLSINLTGATVLAEDFIPQLKTHMAEHPEVSPGLLEFEVLETSALEDITHAGKVFSACEALGFNIALDDFGTGYSSLTYFRRLPVETLKIDQSFIRNMLDDPEDLAIVESVIGLGLAFNRNLVAEGVETADHGKLLVQLGCPVVQGYGIARPMPEADALRWTQQWQPDAQWDCEAATLPAEHRVLVIAEKEHHSWLEAVLAQLDEGVPEGETRHHDYHSCRFGRWYYGLGRIHLGHLAAYQAIEETHRQLHFMARDVARVYADLTVEEKQQRKQALAALGQSLQQQITHLKEIVHRSH